MAKKKTSKGLGDTVEKVLDATGLGKLAKFVLGEDCGCDKRKEKLNKLRIFPHKKPNCLTEAEYNYLTANNNEVLTKKVNIKPSEQYMMIKILSRVSNVRYEPTSCATCVTEWQRKLLAVLSTYEIDKI